jgi:hypothetical protein
MFEMLPWADAPTDQLENHKNKTETNETGKKKSLIKKRNRVVTVPTKFKMQKSPFMQRMFKLTWTCTY